MRFLAGSRLALALVFGSAVGCGSGSGAAADNAGSSAAAVHACTLPADYVVEQYAEIDDGTRVVVALPKGALAESYRLFHGTPDRVIEYTVVKTNFGSSSRAFLFEEQSVSYAAIFPSGPVGQPGVARISIDHGGGQVEAKSMSRALQFPDAATALSGLTLFCR